MNDISDEHDDDNSGVLRRGDIKQFFQNCTSEEVVEKESKSSVLAESVTNPADKKALAKAFHEFLLKEHPGLAKSFKLIK